jgi:hypothetical protein
VSSVHAASLPRHAYSGVQAGTGRLAQLPAFFELWGERRHQDPTGHASATQRQNMVLDFTCCTAAQNQGPKLLESRPFQYRTLRFSCGTVSAKDTYRAMHLYIAHQVGMVAASRRFCVPVKTSRQAEEGLFDRTVTTTSGQTLSVRDLCMCCAHAVKREPAPYGARPKVESRALFVFSNG